MGLIDEQIASDFDSMIEGQVQANETVVYTPLGGVAKTITAVVERLQPTSIEETKRGLAPDILISIDNDAVTGVTSVNTGGDTVTVSARYGAPPVPHPVAEVLRDSTASNWHLRLR